METFRISYVVNIEPKKMAKIFDTDKTCILLISLSRDDKNGVFRIIDVRGKKEDIDNIFEGMEPSIKNGILFTKK
jgi:hypothetical protein